MDAACPDGSHHWAVLRFEPEYHAGTLFPAIGLIQAGDQAMADRYAYVPVIGLFLVLVWGLPELLPQWRSRNLVLAAICGLALSTAAALASLQRHHWRNSITLFEHDLQVAGDNVIAHNTLGQAFLAKGRTNDALAHFRLATALEPADYYGFAGMGHILRLQGKLTEALASDLQALAINPNYPDAHEEIGLVLQAIGRLAEAENHLREAVRLTPNSAEGAEFRSCLASFLLQHGKLDESISWFEASLHAGPKEPIVQAQYAAALIKQGAFDQAIPHFEEALRLKPDLAGARLRLIDALTERKRLAEAVEQYRQLLRQKPDSAELMNNLAWRLATCPEARVRNGREAVQWAERAAASDPRSASYLDTLAAACAEAGRFPEAITAAGKAIQLAQTGGQTNAADTFRARLELYQANRPCRQ